MIPIKPGRALLLIGGLLAFGGLSFLIYGKLERGKPQLAISPEPLALGKRSSFLLTMEDKGTGLGHYRVTVEQDGRTEVIASEEFPGGLHAIQKELTISAESHGLRDGPALLRVEVRDRAWLGGNSTSLEAKVMVDTVPPVLGIQSKFHYVNQGGSGMVVVQASEPLKWCGVRVGDLWFKGCQMAKENAWIVLFAVPHDAPSRTSIWIEAEDLASNRTKTSFPYAIKPKKFRQDTIRVTQEFLQGILPYFQKRDPSLRGEPQEMFLRINRDHRRESDEKIRALCSQSTGEPLWSGPFSRMPNSKPMAGFADRRSYMWDGKVIDEQVHLGVDLASIAMSPVEAANRGKVIFAGELGIYGNTVLLEHGCGLFSMYSHLSQISVDVGQFLEKGEVLGVTGSTGLAGGDHLHFGILVGGVFVNPIEWWDPHWVKDNVTDKLAIITQPSPPPGQSPSGQVGKRAPR
jgi:murein DD-endopeptidase MepM/ murein hydrolase activator NlpD